MAEIWLADHGWHTEVVVPDEEAGMRSWGFGARDFFTAAESGLAEFLAALLPGPAAIVAAPTRRPTAAVALPVTRAGLEGVRRFLAAEIARDADGTPLVLGPAFRPGSVFYGAVRPYSLAYTCNSWTMDALVAGGLPVHSRGTLTARDAMAEARRAARGA